MTIRLAKDPLDVYNSKHECRQCGAGRRARKRCEACRGSGYERIDLSNLWAPSPGFLVCGGPSLAEYNPEAFRARGILSLGVNNAAGFVPTTAHVFGDPQWKFHSGAYLDAKNLTFAPTGKLRRNIRVKFADGTFHTVDRILADCPGVFGFSRTTTFKAETFLTTPWAHWGRGGKQPKSDQPFRRLATMLLGIRLLHYLGCPRVYLVGVDFWMSKEQPYAWGSVATSGNRLWAKISTMLGDLKPIFEDAGFHLFNCNAASKCEVFPHVPFVAAWTDCRGAIPPEPLDLQEWYSHNVRKAEYCPTCENQRGKRRRCKTCGGIGLWPPPVAFDEAARRVGETFRFG